VKLVVELDGGIHKEVEQKEWDENRTAEIDRLEIKVVRFTNEEVLGNIKEVLKQIKRGCEKRKE
jgi:very-short-patch-repair endonuclease